MTALVSETPFLGGRAALPCVEAKNPHYDPAVRAASTRVVGGALRRTLLSPEYQNEYHDNRLFFVCDLGEVYRLFEYWTKQLPRIRPFYAVKCNPDPQILRLLARLGAGFDCASQNEMGTILSLGVSSSRIIFSNPCKYSLHLRYARENGVTLSVFDNEDELVKIARIHPGCRVLLRIATDDHTAVVRLLTKYGASMDSVDRLLEKAKELGVCVVGVHFHCGAGSSDTAAVTKAVADARVIFDKGAKLGFSMLILDVGGGWMIDNNFDAVCSVLNEELDHHFPESMDVTIISEPGRFFPTTAFTLALTVIGKRGRHGTGEEVMVYINDGIYTNMNCIINDHYSPKPEVLYHNGKFLYTETGEEKYPVSCWGQTCDSADIIAKHAVLSRPVEVGDWLFFRNMGAYTVAATTDFNGFCERLRVVYVDLRAEGGFNK